MRLIASCRRNKAADCREQINGDVKLQIESKTENGFIHAKGYQHVVSIFIRSDGARILFAVR